MRISCYLFVVLMSLSLSALPALAQAKPSPAKDEAKPAEAKRQLPPYYVMLAKAAELDDAQRHSLTETVSKRSAAQKKWEREEAPKAKQLQEQLAKLYAKRRKIDADFYADMQSLLRKEQIIPWETAALVFRVKMGLDMKKVKLSDEQQKKMEQLCLDTTTAISKLDPSDGRAREKLMQALQLAIGKNLLTPEQLAQMQKPQQPQAGKNAPPTTPKTKK